MVATGFTQYTGLPGHDPATAGFLPPQDIAPNAGGIAVQPPQGETRRLVSDPVEDAPDGVDGEAVWEPTDEERFEFTTLLQCGKTSKTIDVFGHPVLIESLNVDDNLLIGLYTKDYLGSEAYPDAVRLASCAAAIRTVDGKPLYTALAPSEPTETGFNARLEQLKKYHTSVTMEIYEHVLGLDIKFGKILESLGKSAG